MTVLQKKSKEKEEEHKDLFIMITLNLSNMIDMTS